MKKSSFLLAAMLAAVGVGYFADIPAAAKVMARPGSRVMPDPANRGAYDAAFDLYTNLYETLKPLYPRRMEMMRLAR